ncbi:MAG TPA: MFS transporter [Candidatus Kapabacteria bacterium]
MTRHTLKIPSWTLFDFANSSFAMIMVTFVFPIYFGNFIVTDGHGDLYWGLAMSGSMLLVALLAPALGAIADATSSKKKFLFVFTLIAVACTAGTYFLVPGMVLAGILLFVFANAGFEGGIVFYDAFLPEITTPDKYGRISGYGFAVGYFGSLAAIVVNMGLLESEQYKETFLVTAVMFAVFAIPLFLFVPEAKRQASSDPIFTLVKNGFKQVRKTVTNIRQYPNVWIFLIAFFLYNDAILTVIGFSGRYAKNTLGFTTADLIMLLMMVQVVAVIGSLLFGWYADKRGAKRTIMITLCIWLLVILGAFFSEDKTSFFIVAGVVGLALGSSQSASRSMMAHLTPKEHTTEFFGFYDGFCGKASAVIGPLTFGILSDGFGQRPAIVSLGVFFLAGLWLVRKVKE